MSATETQGGLRMPAEWEPHDSTWLAWPHYEGDWPGRFEPIPWVYAEIIRNLAKHERVELIVNHAAAARKARKVLDRSGALSPNIRFHHWPTNRIWLRDSGCIFLNMCDARMCGAGTPAREPHAAQEVPRDSIRGAKAQKESTPSAPGSAVALKFRFNGWAKYSNWRHDEEIGSLMAKT